MNITKAKITGILKKVVRTLNSTLRKVEHFFPTQQVLFLFERMLLFELRNIQISYEILNYSYSC